MMGGPPSAALVHVCQLSVLVNIIFCLIAMLCSFAGYDCVAHYLLWFVHFSFFDSDLASLKKGVSATIGGTPIVLERVTHSWLFVE